MKGEVKYKVCLTILFFLHRRRGEDREVLGRDGVSQLLGDVAEDLARQFERGLARGFARVHGRALDGPHRGAAGRGGRALRLETGICAGGACNKK